MLLIAGTWGSKAVVGRMGVENPYIKKGVLAAEKGASNWLSVLLVAEHGFYLHKTASRDAICLRFGWRPDRLPEKCICGSSFTVEHALTCNHGGFSFLRHNEISDLSAKLLTEVCPNVGIEPELQPLSGETLALRTANRQDEARVDIRAQGFWGERKTIRLMSSGSSSSRSLESSAAVCLFSCLTADLACLCFSTVIATGDFHVLLCSPVHFFRRRATECPGVSECCCSML